MRKIFKHKFGFYSVAFFAAALVLLGACKEDEKPLEVSADFTFAVDATDKKKVTFTDASVAATTYAWDFGDDETSTEKSPVHTYLKNGEYTVTLVVTGADAKTSTKTKTVVVNDGNLVDMYDTEKWKVHQTSPKGDGGTYAITNFTIENGTITFTDQDTLTVNVGVYQEVEVEAGIDYEFNVEFDGDPAGKQTWLEIYVMPTDSLPAHGSDISDQSPTLMYKADTWGPCGAVPIKGSLKTATAKDCTKGKMIGRGGVYKFQNGGKKYVVLKSGTWTGDVTPTFGPKGLVVSNIMLRKK